MKTPLGAIVAEPVRPREAIEFFRSKGVAPPDARFDYRDWWGAEHARGFVVAKAMQDDVLGTIRGHVDRALAEGRTLDQFRADLEPELRRLGWWGREDVPDPLTGEVRAVQLGSARRLRVIFDTNMRTSRAAGRWARIQRTRATLPFLQYVQIQRPSKREDHAAWHLMVLPVDHAAWRLIYPPNGYFCGCIVRQLSQGALEREGLTVTDDPPLIMRAVPNNRTGGVDDVPVGVTPGFAHNHGAAWLALDARHAAVTRAIPDVPLLPAEVLGAERGLAIEALGRGLREAREHAGLLDLATGELVDWTAGGAASVAMTGRMDAALSAPLRRLSLVHNHPASGEGFSTSDLDVLQTSPGLETLVAVAPDGSVFRVTVRPGQDRSRIGETMVAAIAIARQLAAEGYLAERDLSRVLSFAMARALHRLGLAEYREELAERSAALRAPLDRVIEAVVAEAVELVDG